MGEHLVICDLVGTGFSRDPDPTYIERSFRPSIPDDVGRRLRLIEYPVPGPWEEDGYTASWITCSQAALAELVDLGHVVTVIHEDPDEVMAKLAKLAKDQKKAHEDKIPAAVRKLPKRDSKTKRHSDEKARKGL